MVTIESATTQSHKKRSTHFLLIATVFLALLASRVEATPMLTISGDVAKQTLTREQLIFEVTETMTIDDIGRFSLLMNQLRDVGIRIALDDFGTGWSSMAVLNHLSFDKVKVDRSFVTGMADITRQQVLVDTICHMAHQLGIHVVAEGVETREQLTSLQQMGVDEFQGYFFAKPLSAIDFYAFCIDYLNQKNVLLSK
ncbi:EAL domain-containing protein [Salinivibrio costicola]|uniref:EAL domain-containing protein n=1 Tax=Salinivibrio costicola TaxID=51367 RepID=UPI000472A67C|nr:EAL domain-containing protein [Salinivibrio costicola]